MKRASIRDRVSALASEPEVQRAFDRGHETIGVLGMTATAHGLVFKIGPLGAAESHLLLDLLARHFHAEPSGFTTALLTPGSKLRRAMGGE